MAVNKKQLSAILADLYAVDPDLKRFELELSRMVEEILASRPNTKFDSAFRARLRAELLAHAAELQGKNAVSDSNVILNFFSMKKFAYAGGGAILAALILIPAFIFLYQPGNVPSLPAINQLIALSGRQEITSVAPNAFGSLAQDQGTPGLGAEGTRSSVGFGGGAGVPAAMPSATSAVADGAKMIVPPDFVRYNYVYTGDELSIPAGSKDVFRRITGAANAPSASSLLSRLSLGLINLNSFSNSYVQYVTLAQNESFGYTVNANFEEGTVSMFENWSQWPQPNCQDPTCFEQQRIKIDQVPADSELIRIAQDFVKSRGIDITQYGEPEVDKSWRISYDTMPNKADYWIPEAIPVVFPLLIEGQNIYEQGGMVKYGIVVNVSIRHNRVSSVYNLSTQKYERSPYEVESDSKRILEIAARGGIYSWYPLDGGRKVDVEIGTPTTILMRMYHYDQKNSRNSELLVPALMFPITKAPENEPYFTQKYITIPIIKEMLSVNNDPVRIMPLAEPAQPTPVAEPAVKTN